jgi:glyoxylase-like metal-dependent hydrolase (beta-lactamase superfamily II)
LERTKDWIKAPLIDVEKQTFKLIFHTFVLDTHGAKIVMDPCNGNDRERPGMPFHKLNLPFMERFEATGHKPEDVDYVFCTHLHCDHCGWNTRLRGDRWVPTFPNARYLMVRKEVESADPSRAGYKSAAHTNGVYEDSVAPNIEAGLADLVDDNHRIRPGLEIVAAQGHSAGHAILKVAGDKGPVYFTGDAFHHPLQIADPHINMGVCDDPEKSLATRYALRDQLERESAYVLPAHFPAPYGGRVVRKGEDYRFQGLGLD